MLRTTMIAAIALWATGSSAEQIDRCVIEVGGTTYLDAPCNLEVSDGVVTLGVGDTSGSPFFAYVIGEEGFWNGPDKSPKASFSVGRLTLDGSCWRAADAAICAYDNSPLELGLGN